MAGRRLRALGPGGRHGNLRGGLPIALTDANRHALSYSVTYVHAECVPGADRLRRHSRAAD